jgi:hypothetical protein
VISFADEARCPALGLLRAGKPCNAIAGRYVGILKAELDVLESGLDQFRQPSGVEMNAGGDQVAVQPYFGCMAHELGKVTPDERFAPGEMNLQHSERRGFSEHPLPARRVELGAGAREFEWV